MSFSNARCLAISMLFSGIFFVSPIPHTAALRNAFLLALIVLLVVLWKTPRIAPSASRNPEILALGALTLWMFVQTALWAVDRSASFDDYFREWIGGGVLAAIVGYGIARGLSMAGDARCAERLPAWIALTLFSHAAWTLAFQLTQWVQTGRYSLGSTPFAEYATLSGVINMAFALLAADTATRWMGDGKLLPWSDRISRTLLLITAVAIVAVKARNGVIAVFSVLALLALLLAWRERARWQERRGGLAALLALTLAISLFVVNFRSDPRWATFVETVPIALDTKTHKSWMDEQRYPLPPMASSGQPVEGSAYMRIAWAKVAMEGIQSRPLGFGYGVEAFGRYLKSEYGLTAVSSHSGILDFTLANGIPGLALFLVFCFLLFRRGWLAWTAGNPWGLALMLTLTNHFVRILLDGHFGSFRLKMVALLLGILYWLTICGRQPKQKAT
mgnify:CR=1 FL=1